jgi:Poly(ADP-ribose) polymerase catalytic domain
MMSLLNQLQHFLQKPWRTLLKRPTPLNRIFNRYFWFFGTFTRFGLYLLLFHLRFVNAVYYNIWVHGLWSIRDHLADILNPKTGSIAQKSGFRYALLWLFGLPIRFFKYAGIGILQSWEGILFVGIDSFLPAVTLYHGTQKNASISISKPGKWLVGGGNFAGSGIYFAIDKSVAKHYAGNTSDSVIIVARVTLGCCKNLALAPNNIYHLAGKGSSSGDNITKWGLQKGFKSVEWWREGKNWWEYCLLNSRNGQYVKTRRIRILYVENVSTGHKERIWGGKSFWLF